MIVHSNTVLCFLNVTVYARFFFFYKVFFCLFFFNINRFVTKLILKIFTSVMEFSQHVPPATQEHRNFLFAYGQTSFSFESVTTDFCLENFLKCLYWPGPCFSSVYCSDTCNVKFFTFPVMECSTEVATLCSHCSFIKLLGWGWMYL